MKAIKRRYVYESVFDEVNNFAKVHKLRSPNNKNNFPFYLEQYINHLKDKALQR